MSLYFEELDYRSTPIGALSLQRRRDLALGVDVFEIKLGDDYLMSSLFTASERALANLGLANPFKTSLDVVVGGLGLGARRNRLGFKPGGALGADQRMRGGKIGGERFRGGHAAMESHPSPSASQKHQPTDVGRHVSCGCLQSMPDKR